MTDCSDRDDVARHYCRLFLGVLSVSGELNVLMHKLQMGPTESLERRHATIRRLVLTILEG